MWHRGQNLGGEDDSVLGTVSASAQLHSLSPALRGPSRELKCTLACPTWKCLTSQSGGKGCVQFLISEALAWVFKILPESPK